VATLWIPALVCLSLRLRRDLSPAAWWATVFPLGMYSSATFALAGEVRLRGLGVVSLVFFWIALAAWLTTVARLVARARR
jgi:tellurite resistance protein TehA-like permease